LFVQPDAGPRAGNSLDVDALRTSQSFEEWQNIAKHYSRISSDHMHASQPAAATRDSVHSELFSGAHSWLLGRASDSHLPTSHPQQSSAQPPAAAQPRILPQKIPVLKSKVGRPPKKRPKLGQPNAHFTESFMTQPVSRVDLKVSNPPLAPRSPALPTAAAASKPTVPESLMTSAAVAPLPSGLADYIQLAQLQQPGIARAAAPEYSNSTAGVDASLLQRLHQSLQGSSQLSQLLMPRLDGRVLGQSALPPLGSVQQNADMLRSQQVLMALAQAPNASYLEQLRQQEQVHHQHMLQQQHTAAQMPVLLADILSYFPQLRDIVGHGNEASR